MRIRMWMRLVGLLLVGVVLAACAERRVEGTKTPSDPKLSRFSYIEEGSLVALVASSRPTRYRLSRAYVPLEIAVANKGIKTLTLTRESFTLRDDQGKQYPAVGRDELSRAYGNTDIDRRLGDAGSFVNRRFASYEVVSSNFTPGFDRPIARDHIQLPRFSYLLDFLYFPRPEGDLAGRALELVMRAPELPDPVFVRFRVEGQGK